MEEAVAGFFDELRAAATRAMTRAGRAAPRSSFRSLGAEPVEHVGAPALRFHLHVERAARAARSTRSRSRRRSRSSRPGAPTTPRRASGWSSCSARPSAGARRRTPFSGRGWTTLVPVVHRLDDVHARGAVHLRPRGRRGKYFYSLPDGEVPLTLPLLRQRALPRRRRAPAGRAGPVELPRSWRMPVASWRRMIDDHYPGGGWVRLQRRDARRALAAQGAARACPRSTRRSRSCSMRRRCDRRARRHAALRGLRALPVHARRDQERDADAVRHRLPAGLRGRRPHTFDRARMQVVLERRRRPRLRRRRASCSRRRAPPGRRAPGRAGRRLDRRVRLRRRAGPRAPRDDAARRRAACA